MKKIILLIGILIASVAFIGHSEAAIIFDAHVTGDSIVWIWENENLHGGTPYWHLLTSDWQLPYNTSNAEAELGVTDNLYFAVKNDTSQSSGNPAGFLGSLSLDPGYYFQETGNNNFLSNTTWGILASDGWTDDVLDEDGNPIDPTGLDYDEYEVHSYGANNSSTIWYDLNSGPLTDIDNNAEWIWTANNSGDIGSTDNYAFLHTQYTVKAVPEPASMSLLGMGLLGAIGAGIRSRKNK